MKSKLRTEALIDALISLGLQGPPPPSRSQEREDEDKLKKEIKRSA